jgi:hypothetical protein
MASRNPALPFESHVQSHAEVLKNKLCEFPRSSHSESDRRWLDSDPLRTFVAGSFPAAKSRTFPITLSYLVNKSPRFS